jgi:hypothetical protein
MLALMIPAPAPALVPAIALDLLGVEATIPVLLVVASVVVIRVVAGLPVIGVPVIPAPAAILVVPVRTLDLQVVTVAAHRVIGK